MQKFVYQRGKGLIFCDKFHIQIRVACNNLESIANKIPFQSVTFNA
jgi:hypothetical protein